MRLPLEAGKEIIHYFISSVSNAALLKRSVERKNQVFVVKPGFSVQSQYEIRIMY
jgi:hypothetical protein